MLKNPRRLLIIDDDVDFVTLLVDYFTLEGFDTVPAHNGPEGLAHLAREPFDLVVLDVMMPGMSGVEVLKKMREVAYSSLNAYRPRRPGRSHCRVGARSG